MVVENFSHLETIVAHVPRGWQEKRIISEVEINQQKKY
jgi:hypothetical protein